MNNLSDTDLSGVEDALRDFALMMEGFLADSDSYAVALGNLEHIVGDLKEDLSGLLKTVRDGNGQPPLTTRLAVIEEKVAEADRKLNRWWALLVAAVPGFLAFLQNMM